MNEEKFLSGANLKKRIDDDIVAEVRRFRDRQIHPTLAVVVPYYDLSCRAYAESIQNTARKLDILSRIEDIDRDLSEQEISNRLVRLAADSTVHGVFLELPTSNGSKSERALSHIPPQKDIDGLTPTSWGLLLQNRETEAIVSATAQACIELAETAGPLKGKHVAVIGTGRTVGRPVWAMAINRGATVTTCNQYTKGLAEKIKDCEIVIVGIGKPHGIKAEDLHEGQIIIDAGINVVGPKTIVGDVDTLSVIDKVAKITPVPGGVGPVTTAILFRNLLRAIRLQNGEE